MEKIKQKFGGENRYRLVIISISLLLFLLFFLSKNLRFPEHFILCKNDGLCESFWFYGVWLPFHDSIFNLFVSVFILIFLSLNTLKLWLKIMIPFSLFALYVIITTPDICSGMICFDRTLVASGFGKVFLRLTILIVIIKTIYDYIILKKKNGKI